ncbi:MAG: hypothetical protein ACRBCS_16030 [Cellvibrionaceae bacterium]
MSREESDFPKNIFNTWLDYRQSLGQSRADVIREVNLRLDRKYDNGRFYKWKKQTAAVPDDILIHFVFPQMVDVLGYVFKTNNFPKNNIDLKLLGDLLSPPVKITN